MPHNRAVDAQPDAQDPQTPAEIEAAPSSRPPLWRRFGVWVTVGVVLYVIAGAILLVKCHRCPDAELSPMSCEMTVEIPGLLRASGLKERG